MLRAASTNSEFFREMICPRTTRDTTSQLTSDKARNRLKILRPKTAMRMMTINMYGSPYITSTKRMIR